MPRIPDKEIFGDRPRMAVDRSTPTSQYSDAPARAAVQGLEQIGQAAGRVGAAIEGRAVGMQQTGQMISKFGAEREEENDAVEYTKARSAFLRKTIEAENAAENEPDYTKIPDLYKKIIGTSAMVPNTIRSPQLRARLQSELEMDSLRTSQSIAKIHKNKENSAMLAVAINDRQMNNDAAAAASDEGTVKKILAGNSAQYAQLFKNGAADLDTIAKWEQEDRLYVGKNRMNAMSDDDFIALQSDGESFDLASLASDAGSKTGISPDYLLKNAAVESNGNHLAVSPTGARGLQQFTAAGAEDAGVSNPDDPKEAMDGAARLAAKNKERMKKIIGRDPTEQEISLAHEQGATGASALINSPDALAVDVLTDVYGNKMDATRAVVANGGTTDQTARAFAQRRYDKYNKAPTDLGVAVQPKKTGTSLDYVPYGDQMEKLKSAKQNMIYTKINADPVATYNDLVAGKYNGIFNAKEIEAHKDSAVKIFAGKSDEGRMKSLMSAIGNNQGMMKKYSDGSLSVAEIQNSDLTSDNKQLLFKMVTGKDKIERTDVEKAKFYNDVYTEFSNMRIRKNPLTGKFTDEKPAETMTGLISLQQKLMTGLAEGYITDIDKFAPINVILEKNIKNAESAPSGWFGKNPATYADDVFSPAYDYAIGFVEANKLIDSPQNRRALIESVVAKAGEVGALDIKDPKERKAALESVGASSVSDFIKAMNPTYLGMEELPSVIKTKDGSVINIPKSLATAKATAKVAPPAEPLLDSYKLKDGRVISIDALRAAAKEQGISVESAIAGLKARGAL